MKELKAKSSYESTLVHKFANSHDNSIYKYLSSLTKNCFFPQTMYYGTDSSSTDHSKAQLFNNFFYSNFANNTDLSHPTTTHTPGNVLSNISFTSQDVFDILVSLDPNKAMGTDSISPKVLKHCADLLCVPIQHLLKNHFIK